VARMTTRLLRPAAVALTMASLSFVSAARAQSPAPSPVTSAGLREQAAAAITAGDFAGACAKLDQAVRLDPTALDVRLELARCYEGSGRLQSALGVYRQVETAAAAANDEARKQAAHERAAAIEPKLARLVLVVPDALKALPGVSIQCDGVELGAGVWDVPLPVDKGTHTCTVSAGNARRVDAVTVGEGKTATLALRMPGAMAPPAPLAPAAPVVPVGVFVHVTNHIPARSVALYRIESEVKGITYTRGAHVRDNNVGGSMDNIEIRDVVATVERAVCEAPCDQVIDGAAGQEFFLGGDGITPSSRFRLDPREGRATIKVSPGSSSYVTGGTVLATVGGVAAGVGGVLFPIALSSDSPSSIRVGGSILGVGVAVIAGGVALLVAGKTRYTFDAPTTALRF
jgi:hypothetical protein